MNPLEALAKAASTAPDLLISDVMMPEMSWIDLVIELRKRYPESLSWPLLAGDGMRIMNELHFRAGPPKGILARERRFAAVRQAETILLITL